MCFDCVGLRVVAGCVVVMLLGFVCVLVWVCVGFKVFVCVVRGLSCDVA